MLSYFVFGYLIITLAIGLIASFKVRSVNDFALAGRRLPFVMCTTVIFATWFGSDTVLGASGEFIHNGLIGVMEDPFGASLCLILVGMFFARPFYRKKLLTIGDFYRNQFGPVVEFISSIFMVISYFGWIAAQLIAIGIILNTIAGIPTVYGILLSSLIVLLYTITGGMWSVSITDFIQTIIIIFCLIILLLIIVPEAGGITAVYNSLPEGHLQFFPNFSSKDILQYIAAWITIGLGSIPQQDVFQRVMSAKSEKVAVVSSYAGGLMYLVIGIMPLIISMCLIKIDPTILGKESLEHSIPQAIINLLPFWAQVAFFGALLSAIFSTASGALLAPSVILGENIIRPLFLKSKATHLLTVLRFSVFIVMSGTLYLALSRQNIYELVSESSSVSLVSLFVPLVAGLFFKVKSSNAAILSMFLGFATWLATGSFDEYFPSIISGLIGSFVGLVLGIVVDKIIFIRRGGTGSPRFA